MNNQSSQFKTTFELGGNKKPKSNISSSILIPNKYPKVGSIINFNPGEDFEYEDDDPKWLTGMIMSYEPDETANIQCMNERDVTGVDLKVVPYMILGNFCI